MPTITHNKLVRDKIPDIIKFSGKQAVTRVLTDEEYLVELDRKLSEECAECTRWTRALKKWLICWRCCTQSPQRAGTPWRNWSASARGNYRAVVPCDRRGKDSNSLHGR